MSDKASECQVWSTLSLLYTEVLICYCSCYISKRVYFLQIMISSVALKHTTSNPKVLHQAQDVLAMKYMHAWWKIFIVTERQTFVEVGNGCGGALERCPQRETLLLTHRVWKRERRGLDNSRYVRDHHQLHKEQSQATSCNIYIKNENCDYNCQQWLHHSLTALHTASSRTLNPPPQKKETKTNCYPFQIHPAKYLRHFV